MDRDEFMELVYETFADEPDNVLANGIIEAADAYVEYEKAQLSQEGTTFDTISRQAAIDIFDDYNIAVENGELEAYSRDRKRLCNLPTIQPQSTAGQLNDGARSTNLIDRQAAIDVVDSETVSTNPEHFKSNEKFIKFMDDTDIASFGKWQWANGFNTALVASKVQLEKLPPAQPEPPWIPCEERMPEEHEWIGTKKFGTTISDEVYVTFENEKGERFCKHMQFQNGELSRYDQFHMDTWFKGSKPIAWMPLPVPYQRGGEEDVRKPD